MICLILGIWLQESSTSEVQASQNEVIMGSQIIDAIGTQESVQAGEIYFRRNEHGLVNHLAPFNPNQEPFGEVSQVQT